MSVIPEIEGVEEVNINVKITVKPGFVDDVVKTMKKVVEESRKEEGNIRYDVLQGVENDTTLVVIETWRSKKDLELHFETEHYKDCVKEVEGKTEPMEITHLKKL